MGSHDDIRYLLRRVSELETRVSELEATANGGAAFTPKDDPLEPSPYVKEIWFSGHHSLAIKTYKDETGVGLREAKARVEGLGKQTCRGRVAAGGTRLAPTAWPTDT